MVARGLDVTPANIFQCPDQITNQLSISNSPLPANPLDFGLAIAQLEVLWDLEPKKMTFRLQKTN
jgi:hypothetical protein